MGTLVDPVGLTVLSNNSQDAVVDVVFVHGLQGHPRNTWTSDAAPAQKKSKDQLPVSPDAHKKGKLRVPSPLRFLSHKRKGSDNAEEGSDKAAQDEGVFWPEDLLKADCPKARIMTFGYNTHVTQGFQAVNQNSIFAHARDLLYALEGKRRQSPNRALIFLAHSLGGILVKEVLRRSEVDPDEKIKAIYTSTIGVFFFGTPHRGSKDWASFGEGVATVASRILGVDVNRQVIHALLPTGPELELCRESFTNQWVKRGKGLTVRTFQESKALTGVRVGGFNQLVVPTDSSILDHPNQRPRTIDADHIQMVKFNGRNDRGYQMVKDDIEELVTEAEQAALNPPINTAPVAEPEQKVEDQSPKGKAKEGTADNSSNAAPAIFHMVMNGNTEGIKLLLDYDKSQLDAVFMPLKYGSRPIHIAAQIGNAEIVRLLLQRGADPAVLTVEGCTALHYAVNGGFADAVAEILGRDENGQLKYPLGDAINLTTSYNLAPPLVFAAQEGHTRIVRMLLEAGADPNVHGIHGATPLHAAGGRKFDEIVAALLQAGADPNKANPEGIIPIHVVNSAGAAEMLIAAGSNLSARINRKNPYGFTVGATPLRVCVDSGNTRVVEVIAKHSTLEQLNIKALDGKTAIEAAIDPYKPTIADILFTALRNLSSSSNGS